MNVDVCGLIKSQGRNIDDLVFWEDKRENYLKCLDFLYPYQNFYHLSKLVLSFKILSSLFFQSIINNRVVSIP